MSALDLPDDPARVAAPGEHWSDAPYLDIPALRPIDHRPLQRPRYSGDALALSQDAWIARNAMALRAYWRDLQDVSLEYDDVASEDDYGPFCRAQYDVARSAAAHVIYHRAVVDAWHRVRG